MVERTLAELDAVDPEGSIACCHARAAYDGTRAPADLAVPGIAVGGTADRATPAGGMRELTRGDGRIRYAEVPGAHLAIVEDAGAAAALLDDLGAHRFTALMP